MPIKIDTDIVIHDDMVFQVGFGNYIRIPGTSTITPPINGMMRYNPVDHDFEFYKDNKWTSLSTNTPDIYDRIRFNPVTGEIEFQIGPNITDNNWVTRCHHVTPPPPCQSCGDQPPCAPAPPCDSCYAVALPQPDITRNFQIENCNHWETYAIGGGGVTYDYWDLSIMDIGSSIDFKFETFILPDRFVVEYPAGVLLFDSGWRSSDPTNPIINNSAYAPNVIVTPSKETLLNLTSKAANNELIVKVQGSVNPLTEWKYSLRCNQQSSSVVTIPSSPPYVNTSITVTQGSSVTIPISSLIGSTT